MNRTSMHSSLRSSLILLIAGLGFTSLVAQPIQIEGEFTNCQVDSLSFFALDGANLKPLIHIPLEENEGTHSFSLTFQELPDGLYLIGHDTPKNPKAFLVDAQTQMKLTGNCEDLQQAKIWLSPLNKAYRNTEKYARTLQQKSNQLGAQLRRAVALSQDTASLSQEIAQLDAQKLQLLDSLNTVSPLLAKIIAPKTYLSYIHNGNAYGDEVEYFAKTYFAQAKLSDPVYNRVPVLRESFQSYATTLGSVGLDTESIISYTDGWLNQLNHPSPAHSAALLGTMNGFGQRQPDLFVHYGQQYLDQYPLINPQVSQQIKSAISSLQAQLIGSVAPEIALPTPEGDTLKLSELRGKYVLIDFWASWCGPCRRENPNVVKVYNQYKDKGFEILGVSLDRSRAPWLQAIAKDGLTWLHVSDLSYFNSVAAQDYGVSAIPYTVLLDPEGKIISKNLRGSTLANKLSHIFSSPDSGTEGLNK